MNIEDVWNEMTAKGYSDSDAWDYIEQKYPVEAQAYMAKQVKRLMREIEDHLE